MKENPSFYSILTADIRYDLNLSANEKILFSEITAMMGKTGICWASNNYFAKLYNVSKETISRWINHLYKLNYICVQIIKDAETGQIIERSITMPTIERVKLTRIDSNDDTPIDKNINTPIDKNVKGNNTSINNTSINNIYSDILDYLNLKAETKYRKIDNNFKHIKARLNDGFTADEIKCVIDKKVNEWKGTEFEKYLTPETLFRPSNFEKYLNQKIINKSKNDFSQHNYTKTQMNEVFDSLEEEI